MSVLVPEPSIESVSQLMHLKIVAIHVLNTRHGY
jgi:hypothetical protein